MPIAESTLFGSGIPGYIIVDDKRWLYFNRSNAELLAETMQHHSSEATGGMEEWAGVGPPPPDFINREISQRLGRNVVADAPNQLVIPLKFIDFESGIVEDFSPQYAEYQTIGRHAPYLAYTGGTHREFRFPVLFFDEEEQGRALSMARALQSLTLPWRSETDTVRPQPEVLLSILPLNFMTVRGIIKEVRKTSTTPLITKYKSSGPVRLGIGSVAVDITFLTTEPTADRDIFKYLNEGHMLYDDLASSNYTDR